MPTIRKRGDRWQCQVRIKKYGVLVFATSASFDTKREALHWGTALEAKIEKEGFNIRVSKPATVGSLVSDWLKHRGQKGPVSRGVQHSANALLLAPFASRETSTVTAKDFMDWGLKLSDRLDPATVMHHFMTLRSVYVTAEPLSGVKPDMEPLKSAMDALKRARVMGRSQERTQRVTDDDIARIVLHLKGKTLQIPTDVYVRLAVALPRRREELLTMRWSDYAGDTVTLRDTKHPTKPRTEVVPVPPAARAIIDALPRVPGEDRILPYRPESVSTAFQRAVRAVGLAHIRLHDLRHEGISRLFEQGLGIQEVALISGHVSWAALKRYTHIQPTHVLEKLRAGSQATQKNPPQPQRP